MENENVVSSPAVTRDGTKTIRSNESGIPEIAVSSDNCLIEVGEETVGIYTMEGTDLSLHDVAVILSRR